MTVDFESLYRKWNEKPKVRKPYRPLSGRKAKQFCPQGHDTHVVGRNVHSWCCTCEAEYRWNLRKARKAAK